MLAFLATPLAGLPAGLPGVLFRPAAMPATCVPWSHRFAPALRQASMVGSAAPRPVCDLCPLGHSETSVPRALEKHTSATTLAAVMKGWLDCTPVSTIATAWPCPVAPNP